SGEGGRVILEFSESAAMRDVDGAVAFCNAAHGEGIEVGIDRFGSSPLRLREIAQLPLDFVKLDATLLEMPAFAAAAALGSSFGWRTLASRVSSAQQLRAIEGVGIDWVQGYHLGPPMTVADFLGWAETI
ncbi:MAG TPA: EAL domain-containing protein, partial [Candidatus Acidoferrum sp.]|nr:EAL domain-containing protein [Candidatus Acidoferrum sp.]